MKRRNLIKYSVAGAIGTSLSLALKALSTEAQDNQVVWGYTGAGSPENWGNLSSEYEVCKLGSSQSPIDLDMAADAHLGEITTAYKPVPLKILNNGHTIQINYAPGSSMTIGDDTYKLLQFHFHHPSEHHVQGSAYPMEMHLVHQNEAGDLAVLGVLIEAGEANSDLQAIWDTMPTEAGSEKAVDMMVDVNKLLPCDLDSYRYYGSLTTPPCSEGVRWIVLQKPIAVSQAQIDQFNQVIAMNARPVQALNKRFLLQAN
jgi:carbonic anhydrase